VAEAWAYEEEFRHHREGVDLEMRHPNNIIVSGKNNGLCSQRTAGMYQLSGGALRVLPA
jgi:hypothetical protein